MTTLRFTVVREVNEETGHNGKSPPSTAAEPVRGVVLGYFRAQTAALSREGTYPAIHLKDRPATFPANLLLSELLLLVTLGSRLLFLGWSAIRPVLFIFTIYIFV